MKLRKITALTLAAGMAVSMTACGGGNEAATTTAAPAAKEETTTAAAGDAAETEAPAAEAGGELSGELTVSVWDYDANPSMSSMVDSYMEKNPGVTINVIDTSADEYNNSLGISLFAAQPDPDVIFVKDMGSMLQMADKNQILCLDDFINKEGFDLGVYKGVAEELQYDGKTYGLPWRSDWYILYYNKDLFDAAGVEYPSNDMTWDEYYDLAAKMTSGEGSSKVYGTHHHTWEALTSAFAVQDGEHTVVAKDYSFYKPWYEKTLWLQDNGYMQSYANLKTANIHYSSVFKNQQCAMMPIGTYFIATMIQSQKDGETDFNWGIATIPHPEGKSGYTVGATTPLAISAYTDVPDLAWDFIKYATSAEAAGLLASYGSFPAVMTDEALNTISSIEGFPEGDSNKEALNYVNFVFDRPLDPDIEAVRVPLNEVHEMIMIGEYTIDEGIEELNTRVGEIKGW